METHPLVARLLLACNGEDVDELRESTVAEGAEALARAGVVEALLDKIDGAGDERLLRALIGMLMYVLGKEETNRDSVARALASDAAPRVLAAMRRGVRAAQAAFCMLLHRLCCGEDGAPRVVEAGGAEVLVGALMLSDAETSRWALTVLTQLAVCDARRVHAAGALRQTVLAMRQFAPTSDVQISGCYMLSRMVMDRATCVFAVDAGAAGALARVAGAAAGWSACRRALAMSSSLDLAMVLAHQELVHQELLGILGDLLAHLERVPDDSVKKACMLVGALSQSNKECVREQLQLLVQEFFRRFPQQQAPSWAQDIVRASTRAGSARADGLLQRAVDAVSLNREAAVSGLKDMVELLLRFHEHATDGHAARAAVHLAVQLAAAHPAYVEMQVRACQLLDVLRLMQPRVVADAGAADVARLALTSHVRDDRVACSALCLLRVAEVQPQLLTRPTLSAVLRAMEAHPDDGDVLVPALEVLRVAADAGWSQHGQRVADCARAYDAAACAMLAHRGHSMVQYHGSLLLKALSSGRPRLVTARSLSAAKDACLRLPNVQPVRAAAASVVAAASLVPFLWEQAALAKDEIGGSFGEDVARALWAMHGEACAAAAALLGDEQRERAAREARSSRSSERRARRRAARAAAAEEEQPPEQPPLLPPSPPAEAARPNSRARRGMARRGLAPAEAASENFVAVGVTDFESLYSNTRAAAEPDRLGDGGDEPTTGILSQVEGCATDPPQSVKDDLEDGPIPAECTSCIELPHGLPDYLKPSREFMETATLRARLRAVEEELNQARRGKQAAEQLLARRNSCVVCLESQHTHACMPCGHLCLCAACVPCLRQRRCPVCQSTAVMISRIHTVECD